MPEQVAPAEAGAVSRPMNDQDFSAFEADFNSGQAPAAAPKEAAPAAPAATDPPAEAAPSAEAEKPAAEVAPKKQTAQERINEITKKFREAERELQELRTAQQPKTIPEPQPAPAQPVAPVTPVAVGRPDPSDETKYPFGVLDEKYTEDLAEWKTNEVLAKRAADERQTAQTAAQGNLDEARAEAAVALNEVGTQKHADFQEKVFGGAARGEYALSQHLGDLIVQSEAGADIVYHLATNPDEAAEVFAKSPLEQARYFGRMEARFSATQDAAPVPKAGNPAPMPPKVPPPVVPARGAGGKFQTPASTEDFAAFEAMANAQK